MTETITAIYKNGVFRPLEPVNIKQPQKIKIKIEPEIKKKLFLSDFHKFTNFCIFSIQSCCSYFINICSI